MTAAQALRVHVWAYVAGACALSIANWLVGDTWWSFWPLAAWGVALAAHYLVRKTRSVDEHWVDEHTAEIHAKSYDVDHIDRIARDQAGESTEPRPK
jgi:hypothetical protein